MYLEVMENVHVHLFTFDRGLGGPVMLDIKDIFLSSQSLSQANIVIVYYSTVVENKMSESQ